ncbi:unnamed protein product [Parajaminaea phylloscopi]
MAAFALWLIGQMSEDSRCCHRGSADKDDNLRTDRIENRQKDDPTVVGVRCAETSGGAAAACGLLGGGGGSRCAAPSASDRGRTNRREQTRRVPQMSGAAAATALDTQPEMLPLRSGSPCPDLPDQSARIAMV